MKELLKTKHFRFGVYSLGSVLILAAIIVVINYLSFFLFKRIDLTSNGIYSLSKASRKIIRSLDDPILIKCYFTKNLPAPYNTQGTYLRDLLLEYKARSRGKLKFEFIDPVDEETKKKAMESGIRPLTFTQVESDKYEMKEGYMGLIFLYEDRKEIIPFVKDVSNLEYDITSHIKKLSTENPKIVGFLEGHGEKSPLGENGNEQIMAMISRNYSTRSTNLNSNPDALNEVDCLAVMGPRSKISEKELYKIDQFLMKGKPVAFFVDNVDVDVQSFYGTRLDTGLKEFLDAYGINVNRGSILDMQNQVIGLTTKRGFFYMQQYINYPLFPVITDLKKDSIIVKDLDKITISFAGPIEVNNQESKLEILAQTSKKSWYKENLLYFNPMQNFKPEKDDRQGPFAVAVTLTGKLKSAYADKTPGGAKPEEVKDTIKETTGARIFVATSSRFIQPDFMDPANVAFFMNVVDWAAQDSDLTAIRSKSNVYRPLKDISSKKTRTLIKWLNIFLMPVLLAVYGILHWRRRIDIKNKLTLC